MGKTKHERFDRMEWAFKHDFTGALAKCLVKQSPYPVPDKLEKIIADFHERIPYDFDANGMAEVSLSNMTETINTVLESMPDVMALNERKNGREGYGFTSRYSKDPEKDDNFIDIMAVAQNITCEFAERADAECWLDRGKTTGPDKDVSPNDFVREDRYTVLKKSDVEATLSKTGKENLQDICDVIHNHRITNDKKPLECVVVEHDWPEYETIWGMIAARVSKKG